MCIYRYARACIPSASDRKRSRSDGRGTTGTQSTHKVLKDIRGEHQGTPAVLLGYSRGTPRVLPGVLTRSFVSLSDGRGRCDRSRRACTCKCLFVFGCVCVCVCVCAFLGVCVCV